MRHIHVECTVDGKPEIRNETIYDWDELPWNSLLFSETVRFRKITYINIPAAFDIETTNIPAKNDSSRAYAYMYQWQMCIDKYVVFGRTWESLIQFLDVCAEKMQLSRGRRLVVYVHNLSFEFQFLRRFGEIDELFALEERKVAKFLFKSCFEFRCSYLLSNMTLAKFCENSENVIHYKLTDSYNYKIIRNPDTPLSELEEAYCYNDVAGLCECIRYLMLDDDLGHIPLTSTGYLRREVRTEMAKNPKNREILQSTALTQKLYGMMKDAFRGGDTHANPRWALQKLENVGSYDIQSSYPSVMMMCTFPMGKFTPVKVETFLKRKWDGWNYILRLRASNVRYIGNCGNPYISISKCTKITKNTRDKIRHVNDNGRVQWAEMIEITMTDIDYEIFLSEYTYDDLWLSDIYVAKSGKLPAELLECMMKYYRKKTALKEKPGYEYEYAKSKNKLNAFYGMMVTDIAMDETIYDGEWDSKPVDIAAALDRYYKSRNSFLCYQWGVWVTAHARKRLRDAMNAVAGDSVYVDTDSLKFLGEHGGVFEKINSEIIMAADECGAWAIDANGKTQYMGIWDCEGRYEEFQTMGAKKYIVKKHGKYLTTIAGVSKKKGAEFFNKNGISAFRRGTIIPDSGHLVATYNDDEIHTITETDYLGHICTFTTASNVALIDGTYKLGVTNEYLDVVEKIMKNMEYCL